ncbi:MAG TPA: TolC family protein [Kofleriaceae bacterium]|nr:TolC family protein [Kofleriaceae bacterium]
MRLALLALLVLLLVPSNAASQPTPGEPEANPPTGAAGPQMPLGQVLEVAIRQSPQLALAAIDVAVADAAVLTAAGIDDWVLAAGVSFSSLRVKRATDTSTTNSIDFSGSLSRSLSTGGVIGIGAQSGYSNNPFSLTSDSGGSWSHSVSASISQPLLRGRGEGVARARLRQVDLQRDVARLNREAAAISILGDVIAAYWELAFSIRDLEIRRGSLALAEERLRITRAGIDAGATAPTEALAVEQIIATREEEIVSAELTVLERSITLRRLVGLEVEADALLLGTTAPLSVTPESFDMQVLLGDAFASSPELAALARLEDNATIAVEVTDNGLLPRLDAALRAGPSGVAASAGDALVDMVSFKGYRVSADLELEHTLGNRAARGEHARARAGVLQARINTADARAQIATAMARAVAQARASGKRMELSRRAIELAEKNIDAEKARFGLGRATSFDIAQREEELKLAQLRFARATIDYLESVVQIDAVTGRLLGKYGVSLEDR